MIVKKYNWIKSKLIYFKNLLIVKNLKKTHIEAFNENWFKGKRVAIIGGADSVLKDKLGEYIDGFDVVVRVNKGVEVIDAQKEFVGTRTDFLFHALFDEKGNVGSSPITMELWKKHKVGKVVNVHNIFCSPYGLNNFVKFLKVTKHELKITQLSENIYHQTMKLVEPANGPTTGFSAIVSIFLCNPKEIYITGITFFKTNHNIAYRSFSCEDKKELVLNKSVGHDVEIEYQYVKKMYFENQDIIKPDETLYNIFNNN